MSQMSQCLPSNRSLQIKTGRLLVNNNRFLLNDRSLLLRMPMARVTLEGTHIRKRK